MRPIYFDVTDVVFYAMKNLRVSGIQRVQLKIISCIAGANKFYPVYCTFFHPVMKKAVVFKPLDVLREKEFDSSLLLGRLGVENRKFLPTRGSIKSYLSRYSGNKFLRAFKKLQIYFYAIFLRARLSELGMSDGIDYGRRIEKVKLKEARLGKEDILVLLGANWELTNVIDFSRAHSLSGGEVVQMVHDLIPYSRPDYCGGRSGLAFKQWLQDIPAYVNSFICVSEYTAKELREFLSASPFKGSIKVIPLAHEFDGFARNASDTLIHPDIEHVVRRPFVLCVGTIELRKNGIALLKVWSRLIEKLGSQMPRLVFAGRRGWMIQEFETILNASPILGSYVEIIPSPSDEGLAALYQQALFTVYPSLYEGWGLPVGEAAWFGKTCLASNTTSLPEVCGNLIEYFDPCDIDEMTDKVESLIRNPDQIKSKEAVIRSAHLRTWLDVGNDIFDFLLAKQEAPAQVDRSSGQLVWD